MPKLRLDIVDRDEYYAKSLASYAAEGFTPGFAVRSYTDVSAYLDEAETGSLADIILVGERLPDIDRIRKERGGALVVGLGDGAEGADGARFADGEQAFAGLKTVKRYGGADTLLKALVGIYADSGKAGSLDSDFSWGGKTARVSLAYSREGGAGKSSLAIALCERLARSGRRALYLCLDLGGGADFETKGAEPGMSDIVCALKSKRDRLKLKFSALSRECPESRVVYFAKPDYPTDLDELDADLALTLIGKLRGSGLFDDVVVDTRSGMSELNCSLIEASDTVFVIAKGKDRSSKSLCGAVFETCRKYGDVGAETIQKLSPVVIFDEGDSDSIFLDRSKMEEDFASMFVKNAQEPPKASDRDAAADFFQRAVAIRTSTGGGQGFTRSVLGLGFCEGFNSVVDAHGSVAKRGRS